MTTTIDISPVDSSAVSQLPAIPRLSSQSSSRSLLHPSHWGTVVWRIVTRYNMWFIPLLCVGLWQLASFSRIIPQQILPPPQFIIESGIDLARSGQLWVAIKVSSLRVLYGLTLGGLIGLTLGILVGLSSTVNTVVNPLMQMFRALPSLGMLPLFILWFGIGEFPKILLVALGCMFPLYLNAISAINSIDSGLLEVAHVFHFSPMKKLRIIYLPSITPQILVGLRQAIALAWLSLIIAEQVNASSGVGFIINNARDFLKIDVIIFGLILYAAMGLLSDSGVRWLEKYSRRYLHA